MAYSFKLTIKKDTSALSLVKDGEVSSMREWPESRDMGQRLFRSIEELLTEEGIRPEEVDGFDVDSDLPDGYTSMRIAETVRRVYTFGVDQKTDKQG